MHLRRTLLCALIHFAIICLLLSFLSAQELGTAVLNGAVTDPSGAVVRSAEVHLTNVATGLQRTATTNSSGIFVFNDVAPGDYSVSVKATGFAEASMQAHLEVGQQAKLNIHLPVEKQKTVIEIDDSDAVLMVNTVSSVVDGVVNSHQIDNLPLNGRNFAELALLMPGNSNAPNFDPTKGKTVVISSSGQLGADRV